MRISELIENLSSFDGETEIVIGRIDPDKGEIFREIDFTESGLFDWNKGIMKDMGVGEGNCFIIWSLEE